jgi:hypothetical protein
MLACAWFLAGCGSSPQKPGDAQPAEAAKKYTLAYLSEVSVTLLDDDPDEKRVEDRAALIRKLPSVIEGKLKEEGLVVVTENPGQREGLVWLRAKVKYDPGNRFARWFVGFTGAGKGILDVQMEAVDSVSGLVVAQQGGEKTQRMGIGGGNFYDLVEETVEDLTDNLTDDLSEMHR